MQPGSVFLHVVNSTIFAFPPTAYHTSLIATADDLLLGDLRPLCSFSTDCVVPATSQNILYISNPPPSEHVATRMVSVHS